MAVDVFVRGWWLCLQWVGAEASPTVLGPGPGQAF